MKYIAVHHSGVSREIQKYQFLPIDRYHKQLFGMKSLLGFWGGYNFLIEPNGLLYQYRRIGEETMAQKGHNLDTISICLAGNFDREMPTAKQITVLKKKIKELRKQYPIQLVDILPHRSLQAQRSCYGYLLEDYWVKKILRPMPPEVRQEQEAKEEKLKKVASRLDYIRLLIMRLVALFKLLKRG